MKPTMAAASTSRGGSRSPPFVLVGLVVVLVIVSFYYWRVSTRNSELEVQIEELRSVVRDELSKRNNAEKRTDTVMANLKGCEDAMEKEKTIIAEKENNIESLNKQVQAKKEEVDLKQKDRIECDTNLKRCQDDTNGIRQELSTLKEESAKRDAELKSLKEAAAGTIDKKCDCNAALQEQRKTIETILMNTVGPQAIQALAQNGIGKGEEPAAPVEGMAAPPNQQPGGYRNIVGARNVGNRYVDIRQFPHAPRSGNFFGRRDSAAEGKVSEAAINSPKVVDKAAATVAESQERPAAKDEDKKAGDNAESEKQPEAAEADPDADGDVVGKVGMDDLDTDDLVKPAHQQGYEDYTYSEDEYNDNSPSNNQSSRTTTTTPPTKTSSPAVGNESEEDVTTTTKNLKVIDEARGDSEDASLKFDQGNHQGKSKLKDGIEQMEENLQDYRGV